MIALNGCETPLGVWRDSAESGSQDKLPLFFASRLTIIKSGGWRAL